MRQALVACTLLLASAHTNATTLELMRATDLVDRAELIFVGTAVDLQMATTRDGLYPYTFISFEVETVIKGSIEGTTLTLRFEGGEIGEEYVEVVGMPEFERNGKYLLFVADNGRAISPVVGWGQGKLELVEHPSRPGEKVLLDRHGMAVEGVGAGQFLRSPVVREARSVRRADTAPSGIRILEEDGVTITDPLAPDLAKAGLELAPASVVTQSLQRLVDRRVQAKGYRPGALVRSLTIDDVPDHFSLRPTVADDR